MDDPRSELESMLSSSIDAELPFALERKYVPNWLPNSDARLAGLGVGCQGQCFRLHLPISLLSLSFPGARRRLGCEFSGDQVRQDQVRSGQIRADQVRAGRCATFGMTLGSLWADVWTTLESIWDEFGITLG